MILWAPPQVDDILEDWVWEMVAALKSQLAQSVNVGLAEWVTLAHNHYTTAVRNTRLVGQEIAALLQWLQVRPALTSLLSSPFPSLPPRLSELGWSPTAAKTGQPLLLSSQESEGTRQRPDPRALSDASLKLCLVESSIPLMLTSLYVLGDLNTFCKL